MVQNDDGFYRIIESRHVTFNEDLFPGAQRLEEVMHEAFFDNDIELSRDNSISLNDNENNVDIQEKSEKAYIDLIIIILN